MSSDRLPLVASKDRVKAVLDWAFRSRVTGRITIAQFPNLSLGLYLVAKMFDWVLTKSTQTEVGSSSPGTVLLGVRWAGAICLAWWALDELLRGVNPWRRLLGVFGLVSVAGVVLALVG
jgi:hypothetical protein